MQVDLEKRKIVLDKLFKYCEMDFHLFTELLEILQRHFPDCYLVVPSLQGYELAREIRRFLGVPEVECVFLKGDTEERLLMGEALQGMSFEGILEDTQRHYEERGGVEKKRQELGPGRELSMYWRGGRRRGSLVDAGKNCIVEIIISLDLRFTSQNRTTCSLKMRKAKCNKIVLEEDPRWKN